MTHPHAPLPGELPTIRQLNRATGIALAGAATILLTAVLPAEYGIDPIGTGRLLGLTPMGQMKAADAAASAAPTAALPPVPATAAGKPGRARITLQPGEGREIKATMRAGDEIDYSWSTNGPEVRFEFHGEETGASEGEYTSYEKGSSAGANGKFRAPFDGTHGWYWRNRGSQPVTITASATGTFSSFAAKP